MPMDRSRYPKNWNEIAWEVKQRAGWTCEGCGVPHGAVIVRDKWHSERWRFANEGNHLEGYEPDAVTIYLTVHHIGVEKSDGSPGSPEDKMDNRPENLQCLCQRCHLLADLDSHQAKSKETRIRKKHEQKKEAGQGELF